MGSTRFPGKSLAAIGGRPMFARVVERAAAIPGLAQVIVALPQGEGDDPLAELAAHLGVKVFRGHPDDVLDRVWRAGRASGADVVVRLTADCPLLDPDVSARVLQALEGGAAYASNVHPPTFPDGLDTEAIAMDALDTAWREATLRSDREHVTPFIWRQSERFIAVNVRHDADLSGLRWTVDAPDDLPLLGAICRELDGGRLFGLADVMRLLDERPDIAALAATHARNEGYEKSLKDDHAV